MTEKIVFKDSVREIRTITDYNRGKYTNEDLPQCQNKHCKRKMAYYVLLTELSNIHLSVCRKHSKTITMDTLRDAKKELKLDAQMKELSGPMNEIFREIVANYK